MRILKPKSIAAPLPLHSNLIDTASPVKVRSRCRILASVRFDCPRYNNRENRMNSRNSCSSRVSAMVGEHLDLTDHPPEGDKPGRSRTTSGRRFVGVQFTCCEVYSRVYINRDETAYEGNCPKCAKRVRLEIGHCGTAAPFFTAA